MALFGFGKKKEEEKKTPTCCCNSSESKIEESHGCFCDSTPKAAETTSCCDSSTKNIAIKVLGAGCKSCHEQYENAMAAAKAMGLDTEVEYITDMEQVMAYGVMSMPAVVVNGKVVSMGKVLKTADVEKLLRKLGY
ncbi:MAG: thioredoxin family protein [Oscillospiraceae bacterium]